MSRTPRCATLTRRWGNPTTTRSLASSWPPSSRTSTGCWCSWPWASAVHASLSLQAELYKTPDLFRYIDLLSWSWSFQKYWSMIMMFLVILIWNIFFDLDLFSNIWSWSWSLNLVIDLNLFLAIMIFDLDLFESILIFAHDFWHWSMILIFDHDIWSLIWIFFSSVEFLSWSLFSSKKRDLIQLWLQR